MCEVKEGERVEVEYTDGTTETVPLCVDCKDEFIDGGLVREVDPVEAE